MDEVIGYTRKIINDIEKTVSDYFLNDTLTDYGLVTESRTFLIDWGTIA